MSTWPSVLSTISNPNPTDKLNSPSHSSIESAQNDAISKLETFIGTNASAVGTLINDIRAAASGGGGHVQAANLGGTGQTAFNKGDILVAQSSSVLTKLAVGTDGQAPVADSTAAAGISYQAVSTIKNIQNQVYTYVRASVMSGSVFGVVLQQSPSVLSDGLGLVVKFPAIPTSSLMALQIYTTSNGSVSALIQKTNLTNPNTTDIQASMIGVLEFDSVSSVFQLINPRDYLDIASAQSVTGVKTFTNLPQSPATPSANADLTTKTYVDGKGLTFKNGVTSKNAADASTTQTIAHGLGRTPTNVRIMALQITSGAASGDTNTLVAQTVYNGTTQSSISVYSQLSSPYGVLATTFTLNSGGADSATQTGVVTFDATNITITWTKTGSPSGTYQLLWEATG